MPKELGSHEFMAELFEDSTQTVHHAPQFVIFDIFTFDMGEEGRNDAIYRLTIKEWSDKTGLFKGKLRNIMMNPTEDVAHTVHAATFIGSELTVLMAKNHTGPDGGPTITYAGKSAQTQAPTHSGTVSFDKDAYEEGDRVTVSFYDPDLQKDNQRQDQYLVNASATNMADTILSIKTDQGCRITELENLLFEETGPNVSHFAASFEMPAPCGPAVGRLIATYHDYRDATGSQQSVTDTAAILTYTGAAITRTADALPINITDAKRDNSSGITTLEGATDVATHAINSRHYAVVASTIDNGIQILDITEPDNIVPTGALSTNRPGLHNADAIDTFETNFRH